MSSDAPDDDRAAVPSSAGRRHAHGTVPYVLQVSPIDAVSSDQDEFYYDILPRRGPSSFTMATSSSSTTVLMLSHFRNYFLEPPLPTSRRFRTPSSRKAIGSWHISAPFFSPRVNHRLSLPPARLWTDMSRLVLPALAGVRLLRPLPRSAPLRSLDFFDPPP